MSNNRDYLLCTLLDCGTADLELLENINYDLDDITGLTDDPMSLTSIIECVFKQAIEDLHQEIQNYIANFHYNDDERCDDCNNDCDFCDYPNLDEIGKLNPYEDIDYFINYLDTSIWFTDKEKIYRKYFAEEISDIEHLMGWDFS